jgi:prepilin-type N-terminal cleavage/methylation domain-containing protein
MRRRTEAFSLIEMVVAIAIMAILAGAAVPLAVKLLDQQRAATTRANLQTAWLQMFGSQSARVYNMRADFGFTPPAATLTDLGKMLSANAPFTAVPPAWGLNGAPFVNGWNGPYWNGSVTTVNGYSVPADAWGNPVQLVYFPGQTAWQLTSAGPDGVAGSADDLVYPAVPANLTTGYTAYVYVSIFGNRTVNSPGGTIACQDRSAGAPRTTTLAGVTVNSGATYVLAQPIAVNPGPVSISITFPAAAPYAAVTYSQIADLLPGQTQAVNLNLN